MADAISFSTMPLTHSLSLSLHYLALFPSVLVLYKMLSVILSVLLNKLILLRTVLISKVTPIRNFQPCLIFVAEQMRYGFCYISVLLKKPISFRKKVLLIEGNLLKEHKPKYFIGEVNSNEQNEHI
jgi:hypothetical protein